MAQVPLGFAGPLLVHGEHASGEYFVPLATTEGTLVASYGRGMRLTRAAGGVTATVIDDAMQRAPVFVFEDARAARDFGQWVEARFRHHQDEGRRVIPVWKSSRHRAIRAGPDALAPLQLHHGRRGRPEHGDEVSP